MSEESEEKYEATSWITDRDRIDRYMSALVAADIAGCMNDPGFCLKSYAELAFEAARAVDREIAIEKELNTQDRIEAMRNKRGLNSIWLK
jgi:hypothetical protein